MNESTTPPVSAVKTPAKEDKKDRSGSMSASASAARPSLSTPGVPDEPPSPILSKKQPSRKSTLDSTKVELPSKSTKQDSVPPVPVSAATKTSLPPIRYAAAVAGPATAAAVAPQAEMVSSPVESKSELTDLTPAVSEPAQHEKELALTAASPVPAPTTAPAPAQEKPTQAPPTTNVSHLISSHRPC